jgi:acyl carrier protein
MAIELAEVEQQLKRILVEDLFCEVPEDEIKPDNSIATDLGLDSIGFVEFATIIRERFNIEIDDKDLTSGHFATIKSLSEFILSRAALRV